MKRRQFNLAALGLLASGYSLANIQSNKSTTLTLRATSGAPRSFQKQDGTWSGFEVECTQLLCQLAGLELELTTEHNWKRSLKMMQTGRLDLLTTVSYRKERTAFMDYIGAFDVEQVVLMVRKENKETSINHLDDFMVDGRTTQVTLGSVIEPNFDQRFQSDEAFRKHFVNATGTTSSERWNYLKSSVLRVQSGRIFAAVLDWYSYNEIKKTPDRVERLGFDPVDLDILKTDIFGAPSTYLAASLQVPEEIRLKLHEVYQKIRSDGRFEEIWKKWYQDRTPPPV